MWLPHSIKCMKTTQEAAICLERVSSLNFPVQNAKKKLCDFNHRLTIVDTDYDYRRMGVHILRVRTDKWHAHCININHIMCRSQTQQRA